MSWRHLPVQWLATIYVAVVSMLLFFWLGRMLGPAEFGQYNIALTWAALLGLLFDAGFKTLIFRQRIGGRSGAETLRRAFGHLAVMAFIGLAVGLYLWRTAGWLPLAVLAFVVFNTLANYYSAHLKGMGRFDAEAHWQIGARTVSAFIILAALVAWPSIAGIFFAWALGLLLWLVVKASWLRQHRPVVGYDWLQYKPVAALLMIDVATTVYFRTDVLLLKYLGVGSAEIGHYSLAYKVLEGITLMAAPVAQIFFREMRLSWLSGQHLAGRAVLFMGTSAVLAVLLTLASALWGGSFSVMVMGEGYRDMAKILPWLMLSLCFILPNAFLTQLALASEREWSYAGAAIVAAIANVGLNLWLIPAHGVMAAAWATIITEGVLMACLLWALRGAQWARG